MIVDGKSFGEKVRSLRKQKGLTLVELAEKTNRSVSLLSQIENGNVSPSFSSMHTIADALEINLGHMIAEESTSTEEDSFHLKPTARKVLMTQGGLQHQLLSHGIKLSFEFIILEVPPGASTGEYLYSHDGEECGMVLEGELLLETGDRVHRLKAGDSITLKSSLPHRLSNPGKKKTKAVWVNSSPYIFSIR